MGKGDRESLELVVAGLQKELAKKTSFEAAVSSLTIMFRDAYGSASEVEKQALYSASCRAATLLQSRYTSPGFWAAGARLLEQAEAVVDNTDKKRHLQICVAKAREFLREQNEAVEVQPHMRAGTSPSFLFEGQLTMGAEPPCPPWRVIQDAAFQILQDMGTQNGSHPPNAYVNEDNPDQRDEFLRRLAAVLATTGPDAFGLIDFLRDVRDSGPHPTSKEDVTKLPVIEVTEDILERLEDGAQCAVCRERLVLGNRMQEMPCKHSFHIDCLKAWLELHNSCPLCGYEMKTEWQTEMDREAVEESRGRENAVPGGEYMYT